jgi:hypothetical protein
MHMGTLKLSWEMEAGQLTGRWVEREERVEYSIVLIETGAAREHTMDELSDQFVSLRKA